MNSCIICLEESNDLTKINHCGIYYIHNSCYKKWLIKNKNTCIICKKKLQIKKEINIIYIILIKFYIIVSLLLLSGMCIYIFVICDFKKPFCKLF
jgi:hypothetical protein